MLERIGGIHGFIGVDVPHTVHADFRVVEGDGYVRCVVILHAHMDRRGIGGRQGGWCIVAFCYTSGKCEREGRCICLHDMSRYAVAGYDHPVTAVTMEASFSSDKQVVAVEQDITVVDGKFEATIEVEGRSLGSVLR